MEKGGKGESGKGKHMTVRKTAKSHRIEVKKTSLSEKQEIARTIPILLYRRIALTFAIVVAVLLIVVLYLSTMQSVIRVTAIPKDVLIDFLIRTTTIATTDTEVQGEVKSGTLQKTKTFTPSGTKQTEVEDRATGKVTVYNEMSSAQPLVATTRFLTPDGILFRLKNGVTVPTKGSIEAEVYADQKGASGNIQPTSFTIPGLSEAKQKLVYAKSTELFTGGVKYKTVLSQKEIDEAVESLKAELLEDAKSMLRAQATTTYSGQAFSVDKIEKTISAKAGDEVASFDVTLKIYVEAVFYDDDALSKIIKRKLYDGIGQGQEFVDLGESGRNIVVEQVNFQQGVARLHIKQTGRAVVSRMSEALDVGRFVGMSESEVKRLLVEEGIATSVDVQFFPFWVRTVPRLKDHIYIEIGL